MRLMAASYPSTGSTIGYGLCCELQPSLFTCLFSGILISCFVFKNGDSAKAGKERRFLPAEEGLSGELVGILVVLTVGVLGEAPDGEIVDGGVAGAIAVD